MEELGENLWSAVSEGKVKVLEKFITENKNDKSFNAIINYKCDLYDDDGGNIITHCVKRGRDKGRDFTALIEMLVQNGARINDQDKAKRTPLFWACRLKYISTVSKLLKLGADPYIKDQDGNNPFHISVQLGHRDITSILLDLDPKLLGVYDSHGVPPLVIAVKYGQLENCRLLLERGADVNNLEQTTKRSAVYHAIRNRHVDILELLLRYNPEIDTVDTEGRSVLYLVCECTDVRFFHKIHTYCPKFSKKIMDKPADDNKTPLIIACQQGNAEQVKHLLEEGASTKAVDIYRKTALHYCADNLETQCAEMLLEKDSSIIDCQDEHGYTALALSVLVGNVHLIKLLLEKGANIETKDEEGHKLAHWAAVCGDLKVLDILIQHGADMESKDTHHAYPIHYAAQMNSQNSGKTDPKISEKVLKRVLDCKVSLSVVDDTGRQPLLWAACSGNAESCRMLLKAGANVNSVDSEDLTALHCAASRGHSQCIEILRKNRADLNKTDKNKCTPLFYAITLGNMACTKALLTAKANVNHVDGRGRNPAHCAAIKGCLDTIKLLEKEGCELWHQNNKGDYPVHEAAQTGHLDVVKYLLRQKNDADAVNLKNHVGKTLLHIAAATNNLPLCKLLMNYEACNKNALMKHGGKEFTPYDLAVIKGYSETADYLKSKGVLPRSDLPKTEKNEEANTEKANETQKIKRPASAKATPAADKTAVIKANKRVKKDKETQKDKKDKIKNSDKQNEVLVKTEDGKPSVIENGTLAPVEATTAGESVLIEKDSKGTEPVQTTATKETVDKKHSAQACNASESTTVKRQIVNASNANDKAPENSQPANVSNTDQIRTSYTSLQGVILPHTNDATTQDKADLERGTSPMGQTNSKKKPESGKVITRENNEEAEEDKKPDSENKKPAKRGKVGFENTAISDNEDSGNETDQSRYRHKKIHTNRKLYSSNRKAYVNNVKDSVRTFQRKRNTSRSLQQLRRAQIHTGPMHDIVMFSKMMDHYRQGLGPEEAEVDLRQYANWDGYLNDQLRFVSHLYSDDSKSPRDIQETAKEHHKMLETEANNRKYDTLKRCEILEDEKDRQIKRNKELDREIDQLASKTAEMFDSVQQVASTSLHSAKNRNQKMRDEIRKTREEKLKTTEDPHERAVLQRQAMEDRLVDQQEELETARKIQHKNWYRRKDEEMRQRLLMAYRPTFPNDVFASKSVCISGGRVKSAGRLRVDSAVTPRPRRTQPSPRPGSQKSSDSSNYSAAQYRLKADNMQVQMTPYGLRRVRNQERPTYESVEDELAESIFFNTPSNRCAKSADVKANWSRKYDGSIRPRTGLVFVEPRVYDDLMREDKEAKQRISTSVRHQYTNGDASQHSEQSTEHSESPLP